MNHSKRKPRLEEHVLLPPRRCLAPAAGQAWDHSLPFWPLAPLSATTGLWAERDMPKKQEHGPGEQKAQPCCTGQAWLRLAAQRPPRRLCSPKTKPRSCTPMSQSPRAFSGPGGALQGGGGSSAPTLLGGGGGGEGEVSKVQTRYSPAKTPDWSHWQHVPPRQELGRWRTWCQREGLRCEDNPCGSDIQPPIVQHHHLIPGSLLLPFPRSPRCEGANLYNKHNQH